MGSTLFRGVFSDDSDDDHRKTEDDYSQKRSEDIDQSFEREIYLLAGAELIARLVDGLLHSEMIASSRRGRGKSKQQIA